MRKQYTKFILPLVILLFVGSSGCTSSDIQTVMEVFGGTNGPKAGDVASQTVGGDKTGDKDKDSLLDLGGDTVSDIRKAKELEDEAAVLQKTDLNAAKAKLDEAIVLRPNDWGLQNRLAIVVSEGGKDPGPARTKSADICTKYEGKARERCVVARNEDYEDLLQASVKKQDNGAGVRCSTYLELELLYSIPSIHLSLTTRNAYSERLDALRVKWKKTGCITDMGDWTNN